MSKIASKETNPIIRKNASIGSIDAEMDNDFLGECFYETEDFQCLLDTQSAQRIIVGRTGAGKTALLKAIQAQAENVISLSPENFSFKYLADSSILNFFDAAGVNLNIFYLLLWRHVICVELIKKKYNICNEANKTKFFSVLLARIGADKAKKKAFDYLEEWGDKFWVTTEERIKDITKKLESDLSSKASVSAKFIQLGAEGAKRLSEEQRTEVVNIGKDVVNQIQIQKLTEVINLLDEEIFHDSQERYYLLIDQLDENWAENKLRYQIIRALIDTIKKFQRVKNVKVIIALREDLLLRVIRETKDLGFQEEKIEPLYLRLSWNEKELEKILDLRVNQLFKRQYNKHKIGVRNILSSSKQRDKKDALGYILSRTFLRPREAILFFNLCLEHAAGKSIITFNEISAAEMSYSRKRMRSLGDEWVADYPLLERYANVLHGLPSTFCFSDLSKLSSLDDILLDIACYDESKCNEDRICKISKSYLETPNKDRRSLLKEMVCVFYQVGILGVKLSENYPVEWSFSSEPLIEGEKIKDSTRIYIHPTFWNTLGVQLRPDTTPSVMHA